MKKPSQAWIDLVDPECGLYNRLHLVHFLSESFARARRHGELLSCVLFQTSWWWGLDEIHRKSKLPKSALPTLGRFLLLGVREGDILGRWSDNEFLLITPNTPLEGVKVCTRKILSELRSCRFDDQPGLNVSVRTGEAGIPADDERVRYAEDLPLLAHERLRNTKEA